MSISGTKSKIERMIAAVARLTKIWPVLQCSVLSVLLAGCGLSPRPWDVEVHAVRDRESGEILITVWIGLPDWGDQRWFEHVNVRVLSEMQMPGGNQLVPTQLVETEKTLLNQGTLPPTELKALELQIEFASPDYNDGNEWKVPVHVEIQPR